MDQYDCVIVGAGPAGATFARRSALKGRKTLLIEKESLPRKKVCGGAVTPAIRDLFDFDHHGTVERVVRGIAFVSRDETEDCSYYCDNMAVEMVSRRDFDHYLVRKAVDAGAVLAEKTRVISVKESAGYVTVVTDKGDAIAAPILIGADGARSIVAGSSGLGKGHGGIALEAEVYPRNKDVLDEHGSHAVFGFGFIPKGYGWVFPKKDHFSVGIGTVREHMPGLISLYRQFKARFDFLTDAVESDRRGWFIPFCNSSGSMNTHRICLVGDSAHLVDPFSGEGIYYAVLSAAIAAETVFEELEKQGRLSQRYTKEIAKRITKDFGHARRYLDIFHTSPSFFYKKEKVIRALTRLSNKEIKYGDIFKELRRK
ncbi:MAG: geranylgeranyl reductase family protein [Syntrophorhabdaceae bacterium]|nr:geranylgeranyl reductase family protein [Syntrophorhabdaceae bacterium]